MAVLNVFKLGFKVDNRCGLMVEGGGWSCTEGGAWHLRCGSVDREAAGHGLAARPEEDKCGRALVVRERRGGTGLVGLQLGLVVGQGRVGGGLWPGRLIWAKQRWQILCGVCIREGKAVFQKYAFVAGTRVSSGARAYWAGRPAGPRTVTVQLGPQMRVGRWASRVEKGEEGQAEIEEGLGSCLNGI
jgi:hypothetical protein